MNVGHICIPYSWQERAVSTGIQPSHAKITIIQYNKDFAYPAIIDNLISRSFRCAERDVIINPVNQKS